MAWRNLANLNDLLTEVNACGPARDKGADGAVGNEEHQAHASDHNPDDTAGSKTPHTDTDSIAEVHARDFDTSGPWLGRITAAAIVSALVTRMRKLGQAAPLAYVIHDRHLYEYPHFATEYYGGSDPHTGHFHCSSRYGSGTGTSNPENYTGSWGIKEALLMLSSEDKAWFNGAIANVVDDFLTVKIGDKAVAGRTVGDVLRDVAKLRGYLVGDVADTTNAAIKDGAPVVKMTDAADMILTPAPDPAP